MLNLEKFEEEVKKALKKYNGKMALKPRKGIKQYSGKISWYHVSFGEEIRTKLLGEYKDIEGFNIMPYRIYGKDVENAKAAFKNIDAKAADKLKNEVASGFRAEKPFNKIDIDKGYYVDFDETTANFHKKGPFEYQIYQIVLTAGGSSGPGWIKDKIKCGDDKDKRISKVKTNYYFPKIESDKTDDKKYTISALISMVMKELGILSLKN